ncbi:MAG: glycosyltransferase family 87 protein [Thermoleophilia bacterium]
MNRDAPDILSRRASMTVALLLSTGLTLLVLVALFPNLWYGLHDITDIPIYHNYAQRMAAGEQPYTQELRIEYPPLAVPFFRLPGHVDDLASYMRWFSIWMGILTLATAAITTTVACRVWPYGNRAYAAAVLFPVGVALTGAIIVNRYDVAVALVMAAFLLCLIRRWFVLSAVVLGLGFALKMTPAAMLPLVLIMAGPPKRWIWPIVAFIVAAAAPFVRPLLNSADGVWYVFQYHLGRPLQIESVLGTPMLIGQMLGAGWARYGYSYGSHFLIAPGAGIAAAASGGLTLLAIAGIYALVWQRRRSITDSPEDQILVVLAITLALMTFSKVLSPQYMIWLLPTWTLVAARDRLLGILGALVLLLTQVEFPSLYGRLLGMRPETLAIVSTRNILLLLWLVFAAWRLWRIPTSDNRTPARDTELSAGAQHP